MRSHVSVRNPSQYSGEDGVSAEWVVIHGRFQPFHLGHLEYLNLSMERSRRVVVGITNPILGGLVREATSEHRHRADTNPFTYFDRAEMIAESAAECPAYDGHLVRIVPFDVSDPSSWNDYLPRRAIYLVTLNEPWDHEKCARFAARGLRTETIEGNPSRITATQVRRRMSLDTDWRDLVPKGTAHVIEQLRASATSAQDSHGGGA
ncbi:nicotinamide-nucleotide adenylyltransferase [Actinomadura luteofluorescens]